MDGVDLSSKMAEYAAELCSTDDGKVERADAATRKATGWETVYRRVETGNSVSYTHLTLPTILLV